MSRLKTKCVGGICRDYVKSVSTGRIAGWDHHVSGNRCEATGLSLGYMAQKGMICPHKGEKKLLPKWVAIDSDGIVKGYTKRPVLWFNGVIQRWSNQGRTDAQVIHYGKAKALTNWDISLMPYSRETVQRYLNEEIS